MSARWQPSASLDVLVQRAGFIQSIRQFFIDRKILEVETPALSSASITDPTLQSFQTQLKVPGQPPKNFYLQTSPEFHMKRLLAAGSGPIFQICKSFRNEEKGRLHNPEFTMLEWYRPGFNHHDLMQELDALLQSIIQTKPADKTSYRDLFIAYCDIDLAVIDVTSLRKKLALFDVHVQSSTTLSFDDCLHLILSHYIEPKLGLDSPLFIYDFPQSQSALAKIRKDDYPVAERFELYINGIECANGFHELCDAAEQEKRFEEDNLKRAQLSLPEIPICQHFLNSLQHGLPDCAGVAVGLDRLFLISQQLKDIQNAVSFDSDTA